MVRLSAYATMGEVRITGNVTLQVTRADNIEVEDSETQNVLRLRNGDSGTEILPALRGSTWS